MPVIQVTSRLYTVNGNQKREEGLLYIIFRGNAFVLFDVNLSQLHMGRVFREYLRSSFVLQQNDYMNESALQEVTDAA